MNAKFILSNLYDEYHVVERGGERWRVVFGDAARDLETFESSGDEEKHCSELNDYIAEQNLGIELHKLVDFFEAHPDLLKSFEDWVEKNEPVQSVFDPEKKVEPNQVTFVVSEENHWDDDDDDDDEKHEAELWDDDDDDDHEDDCF